MALDNNKLKKLYDGLRQGGYEQDYNTFIKGFTGNENFANRKQVYDLLTEHGAQIGDNYSDFMARMQVPKARLQPAVEHTQQQQHAPNPVPYKVNKPVSQKLTPAAMQSAEQTIASVNNTVGNLRRQAKDFVDYNTKRLDHPIISPEQSAIGAKHVWGQSNKVVKGKDKYNPNTGKIEETYTNETGQDYSSLPMANAGQKAMDDYRYRQLHPIDSGLKDAYTERDRLQAELRKRYNEIDQQRKNRSVGEIISDAIGDAVDFDDVGGHVYFNPYDRDPKYTQLLSAARKNKQTINTLEDAKNGTTNNFWHSLYQTATNGYTFLRGSSEVKDVQALMYAKQKLKAINRKRRTGQPLTKDEEASESVLKNTVIDNDVQGKYGQQYGNWADAGKTAANSIDFMSDFIGMPVAEDLTKAVANKAAALGGKAIAKAAGDSVAKAAAKTAARGLLKATGIGVGAHLLAGPLISNTTGADRTTALMGKLAVGDAATDKDGNYTVNGSNDLMSSLAEAERQQSRENGSEMAGGFIPGGKLAVKGLEKIGLSKIAGALTKIGDANWYKQYSSLLKAGGYNGIPGEALEEYEGEAFDALTGHGKEAWKDFTSEKNNVDIWLGCATMCALMGAAPVTIHGYHTAQYYNYKHKASNSDKVASYRIGADKWASIKDNIDQTDNANMADAVIKIINDKTLHTQEKTAALKYVRDLTKMRGYNIAQVNNAGEANKDKDLQAANNSYSDGYETTESADMNDAKNNLELKRKQLSDFVPDETINGFDDDAVSALNFIRTNPEWTEEEKKKAIDYVNAKSKYDGMIHRVQDDLDSRVTDSNETVDSRVDSTENGGDGQIHPATLKLDNRKVYVIGGNLAVNDDGQTIDVENSDESIIVRDADTGEVEFADPRSVLSVDETIDPDAEKEMASRQLREQYAQECADKIEGVLHFRTGETYTLADEAGTSHTYNIVSDNGNDTVNVIVDGNAEQPQVIEKSYLQGLQDKANIARLQDKKQQPNDQPEQPYNPQEQPYNLNDEITLYDEDGNAVNGTVTNAENEDGLIEVTTDTPINGKVSNLFTKDELDAMAATDWESPDAGNNPQDEEAESVQGGEDKTGDDITQSAEPDNGVVPMPMVGEGENAEPDFYNAEPKRSRDYIYDETGLSKEEADGFVAANAEAAEKALGKARKEQPKIGTSLSKYNKQKADWQKKVDEAQKVADYWAKVKDEQRVVSEKEAAEKQQKLSEEIDEAHKKDAEYRNEQKKKAEEQAKIGTDNVSPAIKDKWDGAKKLDGASNEIVLPNGERVTGHYVLAESGAASPSHNATAEFAKTEGFPIDRNAQSVNDRDYERDQDAQRITREMADKYDSRAMQTPVVVSNDGVVVSGNGRTMAGEIAAKNNTDGAYIEHLKKYPQQYGFTQEQVSSMQHPRVLFVPDEAMSYTPETFAKFNQQEMKGQSKSEHAVKLGKIIDDATYNRIIMSINRYDTIGEFYADTAASTAAINDLYKAGAFSAAQMAEMFDGDTISSQAKELLENVLVGKAFEANPDAIRQITAYKSMRQSVITALGEISNNRLLGDDYSLANELSDAISLVYHARNSGIKAGERASLYARQGNLFKLDDGATVADYTNATIMILADIINDNRITLVKKYLSLYNARAKDSANGQADIFTGAVESKQDILNSVNKFFNNASKSEQQKAVAAANEKRKSESVRQNGNSGSGTERPGGTGEQQEVDVDDEIDRARKGDKEAQSKLKEYGIDWGTPGVYRHVAKREVDALQNGETIKGKSGDGRVDVTASETPSTGQDADYRIKFKGMDLYKDDGRTRMKNSELTDGWIVWGGYTLDDVDTIEKRNDDGSYTVVYKDGSFVDSKNAGTAKRLTEKESDSIIAKMEENAEVAPEVELTINNWDKLFGEDGKCETPIGEVKMGENQFTKLMRKGRNGKLGMIKPTLESPDIIIEDDSSAKDGDTSERNSSLVFVKTFKKEDGSRYYYFTSVTVRKDNLEVVISNQEKRKSVLTNLLVKGKMVWKHADDVSTASDVADGLYSSQGKLSDLTTEGTDAPQTNVSAGKGSESSDTKQENGEKYKLSDEIDENGRQFVLTKDGDISFGYISSDTGLTTAPIMLSEGVITNPATNDGYGLVHIEARHGKQIRAAGYESVIGFIEDIAHNYETIKEGKDRNGNKTYLLQLTDKPILS